MLAKQVLSQLSYTFHLARVGRPSGSSFVRLCGSGTDGGVECCAHLTDDTRAAGLEKTVDHDGDGGAVAQQFPLNSTRRPTREIDTVEVCGSSPHGPTISFSELASTTSLAKAPNGSTKEAVRNYRGHLLNILRQGTCIPAGPLIGNVRGTHQSRRFRIRECSVRFAGRGGFVGQQTDFSRGTFFEVSSLESPRLWLQTDEKDAPAS
jgi:hypothetical protein